MSASDSEPITASGPWPFLLARSWKALMTPMTVPKRPTKGALLPRVPRKARLRSSLSLAALLAEAMALSTAVAPRSKAARPAEMTSPSMPVSAATRFCAPVMSSLESSASSSRRSPSKLKLVARKYQARSIITATLAIDRKISSHRTHSAPSRATGSIRSVRLIRDQASVGRCDAGARASRRGPTDWPGWTRES